VAGLAAEARFELRHIVMPGLVPGIHVLLRQNKVVDGRVKPGHDEKRDMKAGSDPGLFHFVIASEAKQSRVRGWTGLLRLARNDEH
jgi:hypothetical protein